MRKVIIVGGGPSGLTAALYTSRATLQPLVIEGDGDKHAQVGGQPVDLTPGGQLMTTTLVENFPGFPDGVNGPDLMDAMRRQAEKFGAELVTDRVTAVDLKRRPFRVTFGDRTEEAQAVVLSTGASTGGTSSAPRRSWSSGPGRTRRSSSSSSTSPRGFSGSRKTGWRASRSST